MTLKSNRRKLGLQAGMALWALLLAAGPSAAMDNQGLAADPNLKGSRDDKTKPSNQFLTAYNSMALADWLKEKGMQTEAADLYNEALDLFGNLAADYPQWQPTLVTFRINYCREALKNLSVLRAEDRRQMPEARRQTTDARSQTPEDRGQMPDARRQTPEARRQTTDDGRRTPEDRGQTPDDGRRTTWDDGTSAISNQASPERSAQASRQSAIGNQPAAASNAVTLSPLNSKLQQAAFRERGRDYTGALSVYIALLEEFPREPSALKGACRCYLHLERMDWARALTRQALALPAPDAEMHLLAALAACYDGRYQAALPLLRQSLKQNGACPETHVALGVALAATGQMEEAQKELKRALALNPRLADVYYNLARLSLRQKPRDRDTARVHYQNALRYGAAPDPELDKWLAE